MEAFSHIIKALVFASVGIGAVQSYLTLNKIWIRKHERTVAESISVFAAILGLITLFPFFLKYLLIDHDYNSLTKASIGMVMGCIFFLISIGYWVKTPGPKKSFWSLVKKAFKLEKQEAGDLVKFFLRPQGGQKILTILHQLALIDQKFDDKEKEFIKTFARSWKLDYDLEKASHEHSSLSQEARYIQLQKSIASYLSTHPPLEQAAGLREVIQAFVKVDDHISEQEEFIIDELVGQLDHYVDDSNSQTRYQVIIAPQNSKQVEAVKNIVASAKRIENKGVTCFMVGQYFSLSFARLICRKYRAQNLFTIVEPSS